MHSTFTAKDHKDIYELRRKPCQHHVLIGVLIHSQQHVAKKKCKSGKHASCMAYFDLSSPECRIPSSKSHSIPISKHHILIFMQTTALGSMYFVDKCAILGSVDYTNIGWTGRCTRIQIPGNHLFDCNFRMDPGYRCVSLNNDITVCSGKSPTSTFDSVFSKRKVLCTRWSIN